MVLALRSPCRESARQVEHWRACPRTIDLRYKERAKISRDACLRPRELLVTKEEWLADEPSSPGALSALREAVPLLPSAYLSLLSRGNGGEAELSVSPFNLCIDSAESALEYWQSGSYTMNGVFVFGGNGGGELLAFDMRQKEPWPVISFDPIDPEGSVGIVADEFSLLLKLVTVDQTTP